jgi:ParB-like chromosome segregation protein Spo0J
MQIEKVNIEEIKMYEYNAKKHPKEQIEQIKKSIREFGFNDPIAIDEDNTIIEGHGRLLAIKELGYKEVECIKLLHLTEEQKRAYILIHNKLTMNTGFDIDILNEELKKIKSINMGAFDLEIIKTEEVEEIESAADDNEIKTVTLSLDEEQYQLIMNISDFIKENVKELHTFGNKNKRSNIIFEVVYQWEKQKML